MAGMGAVKLPKGRMLIPGVISHATNVVEHPELVAERLVRLAKLSRRQSHGRTDCAFAQGPFVQRVHPSIMWAKLRTLVEGAGLLRSTWGRTAARHKSEANGSQPGQRWPPAVSTRGFSEIVHYVHSGTHPRRRPRHALHARRRTHQPQTGGHPCRRRRRLFADDGGRRSGHARRLEAASGNRLRPGGRRPQRPGREADRRWHHRRVRKRHRCRELRPVGATPCGAGTGSTRLPSGDRVAHRHQSRRRDHRGRRPLRRRRQHRRAA